MPDPEGLITTVGGILGQGQGAVTVQTFDDYLLAYAEWLFQLYNNEIISYAELSKRYTYAESLRSQVGKPTMGAYTGVAAPPLAFLPDYNLVADRSDAGELKRALTLTSQVETRTGLEDARQIRLERLSTLGLPDDYISMFSRLSDERQITTLQFTEQSFKEKGRGILEAHKELKRQTIAEELAAKKGRIAQLLFGQKAPTGEVAAGEVTAPGAEQVYGKQLEKLSPQLQKAFESEIGGVYAQFEAEKGVNARNKWFQALEDYETQRAQPVKGGQYWSQMALQGLTGALTAERQLSGMTSPYLKGLPASWGSPVVAGAVRTLQGAKANLAAEQAAYAPGGTSYGTAPAGWGAPPKDPWEEYLAQYPFLHQYLSASPRQRGVRTTLYKPPTVWG